MLLTLAMAAPLRAQTALPPPPAPPAVAVPWNPVAPYITAGQDEPGYRLWYAGAPWRPAAVRAFHSYLTMHGVGGVFPTWQLLRTATSWQRCGGEPFEVPPAEAWPHIVQTLRYVHGFVIPSIGPVEPVSGYRNPALNQCAGGAVESAHKSYSAIDMVPLVPTTREAMMRALCAAHSSRGGEYQAGLGFYAFVRFHVDTTRFRRWGTDPAQGCPPIVRPADLASVAIGPPPAETGVSGPSAPLPQP